jgi:hypothetical protein
MKKLFFILLVSFASRSFGQSIDWQQTHGWKIYVLRDKKGMRTAVDSLKYFRSITLDDDSVKYFLVDAKEIARSDEPVWMGANILSDVDSSGLFRKIDASVYGGFFYDEQSKKYFQLSGELKEVWMRYLNRKEEEMQP